MNHEAVISGLIDQPASFHQKPWQEQLAILQNLTLEHQFPDKIQESWRLTPADVDLGELAIVYRLLYPDLQGAFAAAAIEGINKGLRYLPANASEYHEKILVRAVKNGLWDKYVAVWIHDLRLMSEVVHSVSLLSETALNKPFYTASPGLTAPVIENAFRERSHDRQIAIIGAFSPVSVMDIWRIHDKIIKPSSPQSRMTILDIEGELTPYFARHYGVNYVLMDGMKTGFPDGSFDAIITDFITPWLKENEPTFREIESHRYLLFQEINRILRPGGLYVSCEEPVIRLSDTDKNAANRHDAACLEEQLTEAGFSHVKVSPGQRFRNRYQTDLFFRNSDTHKLSIITARGNTRFHQIIAQK